MLIKGLVQNQGQNNITEVQQLKKGYNGAKGKLLSVIREVKRRTNIDFDNEVDLMEIIEILAKDKYSKTQLDVDILRMAFIRINFFSDLESKMTPEYAQPLYKELNYEKMQQKQVVFNLGDLGRKFYIILKGSVWVLVKKRGLQDGTLPTKDEMKAEEDEKRSNAFVIKQKKRKVKTLENTLTTNSSSNPFMTQIKGRRESKQQVEIPVIEPADDDLILTDAQYVEKHFPYFIQAGTMDAGDSFGEIALSKQIPRTATIVCSEQTHFVTVTREAYNKLLSEYYQIIQQINVKLLQQVSMFSDWNEAMLNQLYYHFTFKTFTMNQIIYKENDESNEIYLVKEGEVEISRIISIRKKEPTESEKLLANFISSSDRFAFKSKRIKQAIITLSQVFGQEEVIAGCNRNSMAICVSDSLKVFVLEKSVYEFLQYCARGKALDKIIESSYRKNQWRSQNSDTLSQLEKPKLETNIMDGQLTNYLLNKRIATLEKFVNQGVDQSSLQSRRVSNFVIPKIQNIITKVSNKINITSSKLLQEKTHMNSAVENFTYNYDSILLTMKPTKEMTITSGFFDLDLAKIPTSLLLTKANVSGFQQNKESHNSRPRKVNKSTDHLIKHLKLPHILKHLDTETKSRNEVNIVNSWRKIERPPPYMHEEI